MAEKQRYGYAWLIYRDDVSVFKVDDLRFFKTLKEAMEYRKQNTPNVHDIVLVETVAAYINEKLIRSSRLQGNDNLSPDTIKMDMDTLHVIGYESEKYRARAEDLNSKLQAWGINNNLTAYLQKGVKNAGALVLHESRPYEKDHLQTTLFLEPGAEEFYQIHAFTSALRRHIEIPDLTIGGINARRVDRQMSATDWSMLDIFAHDKPITSEIVNRAIAIQLKLEQLSQATEGKLVTEKLMAKHWLNTPVEGLIPNPQELDKKYIIRQNFDRIGDTIFSQKEAYNIMCERYVSKTITEGGSVIEPWYYRHTLSGPAFSNIVRITNSEQLDLQKQFEKLNEMNIKLSMPEKQFITSIRQGDELKLEQITNGYRQSCMVHFNPFLNDMEIKMIGSRQKIDLNQNPDQDLNKGLGI